MTRKPTELNTNEVRISYEHLLKPYANQPGAEEKYSATLLIPKSDVTTKQRMDAAIQAAAQEGLATKWGGVRPAQLAVPIYDGDGVRPNGEAFGPECKGHWVMTASSKQRPEIVDEQLAPIIDATQIYSGMYACVNINFFAYFNSGKKGVGCGLGPVKKTRDGEPLGGRVSAAEAFGGAAPAYQPQAYHPQQPQYAPQQPQYAPPQQYAPAGAAPWVAPAQPQYAPQQPQQPQYAPPQQYAPVAVDPITGLPAQPQIMGL
jgi:hypothetical protein